MRVSRFGDERLVLPAGASRQDRINRSYAMLSRALNLRTTVAFVGAGCSKDLGYKTWTELAGNAVNEAIRALASADRVGESMATLKMLQRRFEEREKIPCEEDRPKIPSSDLLNIFGLCERALSEVSDDKLKEYRKGLAARFSLENSEADKVDPANNPYIALLKLRITRFVTSNYDCEIENAFAKGRQHAKEHFGIDLQGRESSPEARRRSFTQKLEHLPQLAMFSVARPYDDEIFVFHCHGRYDDVDSIIATESDYQRWYFKSDESSVAFRQTIDLLFASNPILFVGFGMDDEDLLRPLRMLTAVERERRNARPLFALMPTKSEDDNLKADWLFERYGLNVIPYNRYHPKFKLRGAILSEAIREVQTQWDRHLDQWWDKPVVRRVTVAVGPPDLYRHYGLDIGDDELLDQEGVAREIADLQEMVSKPGVVVIMGRGGSGKSWRIFRLLEKLKKSDFKGRFFWSSYYSDDWLTGIDRALRYMEDDPESSTKPRRAERWKDCLERRYLLVFDGFERLLHETEPEVGAPTSKFVEALLTLARDHGKSTVVLTSRLWPKPLKEETKEPEPSNEGPKLPEDDGQPKPPEGDGEPKLPVDDGQVKLPEDDGEPKLPGDDGQPKRREDDNKKKPEPRVHRFSIKRVRTKEVANGGLFTQIFKEAGDRRMKVSGLCSLLDGHAYALVLAAKYLENQPQEYDKLHRALGNTPPDRRVFRMIAMAIEDCDAASFGEALPLLERLSVFCSPVDSDIADICYDLVPNRRGEEYGEGVRNCLLTKRLLFPVAISGTDSTAKPSYAVHPLIRDYIFRRIHHVEAEPFPRFALAGFTSATASIYPGGKRGQAVVIDLFNRLYKEAEKAVQGGQKEVAAKFCRGAFGVLRSRTEANTAPLWTSYHEYSRYALRLINLAKDLLDGHWRFLERVQAQEVERDDGIFYADELAWLYNDFGLALCGEGSESDTYAVWEQGYEISRVTDSSDDGGQYIVQSRLHMAHTFLELGRLGYARSYLDETDHSNHILGDPDYDGRINGYRALLEHLSGNLEEANRLYGAAIGKLRDAGRNYRAESIFLRHRADLMITLGQFEKAEGYLRSSAALAEAGHYRDLIAYVRSSRGHLHRVMNRLPEAQREYQTCLEEATAMGIRRLVSDVYSEMARLAIKVVDPATARQRANQSLMLANELHLGLRQTSALVVLGHAMILSNNRSLGIAYLEHAERLALEQDYHLRRREAEDLLRQFRDQSTRPDPSGDPLR